MAFESSPGRPTDLRLGLYHCAQIPGVLQRQSRAADQLIALPLAEFVFGEDPGPRRKLKPARLLSFTRGPE